MANLTFDFSDHCVLVTGAAAGIGRELARKFLDSGARVGVVDRDESALAAAWGSQSDRVRCFAGDVADETLAERVVGELDDWGGVDVLVNNAGITRDSVLWRMSIADWRAVLDVHLTGTFLFTHAVVPGMRKRGRGRIINVTSYSGIRGNVGQANYAAAKAGIIGFTKTVAKETARFGITVNALSPNAATAMVAAIPEESLARLTESIPMQRFADPVEMAAAVCFLASDEAAYVTGAVLPVDGGVSM